MKIAILTNFQEANPGYSLTGIVLDQITMLQKYGHEVHFFVSEKFNKESHPLPPNVNIAPEIPHTDLIDYRSIGDLTKEHSEMIELMTIKLSDTLKDFDIVYTHDFIFTGWNMPYGIACQEIGQRLTHLRWMHWVHSTPTAMFDWWDIRRYGPAHKIIFPNNTERQRVAENFRGSLENVRTIPHIKDLRTWFDFSEETCELIDYYPGIMQADIVQVYPASSDRLAAKQLETVILIFSKLKKLGFSICLVCANQWATGKQPMEDIERYKKIASRNGLKVDEDFIFTSEFRKSDKNITEFKRVYPTGLSKRILRELMLCSNLFIFPTREESFGLVGAEVALTASPLMVLNKSLQMMFEVHGFTGIYFDFGSFAVNHGVEDLNRYYQDIAQIIVQRLRENDGIMTKTFHRKTHNMDNLYKKRYAPIMAESKAWC